MSDWASGYIAKLAAGETVSFRPRGNSMVPKIKSGQLCTVEPVGDGTPIEKGDVVLCKVGGRSYLHLVRAVGGADLYQIGNMRGHINGHVSRRAIYGKLARVEP